MIVVGGIHAHAGAGDSIFAEGDARDDGFFGEGAISVVAIQLVGLCVVRKEEIGPAIIVVIEHGDAQRLRGRLAEAGFLGYLLTSSIAAILPQAHRRSFLGIRWAIRFAF